jgi:hypothetical protein
MDAVSEADLYTLNDLDFLAALRRGGRFSAREISTIERHVRSAESYFIPRAKIIYLADLTVHRAAEEATHFIHAVRSGLGARPMRRSARDAFYVEALAEALGFFGSRVIDPKRTCLSFPDLRDLRSAAGSGSSKEERMAENRLRETARLALAHRAAEERHLSGKHFSPPAGLFLRFRRLASNVAHVLGYILGDKLHVALTAGRIEKALVRELFLDSLPPGRAEARYRALVQALEGVDHGVRAGCERF